MKRALESSLALVLAGSLAGCALVQSWFGIDDQEAVAAEIRGTLLLATDRAVERLGRPGGYWGNRRYRIPLPEMTGRAARYLRLGGHGGRVEAFHQALNRAAEDVAPHARPLLAAALAELPVVDPLRIAGGPGDAGAAYLERQARQRLVRAYLPSVRESLLKAGIPQLHAELVDASGPLAGFLRQESEDLALVVTERALDGLFRALAEEERRIRRNQSPAFAAGSQKSDTGP